MDTINIPTPIYKSVPPDETDSPPQLIQVQSLTYGQRHNLNPKGFFIRNDNHIVIKPKKWRVIIFPIEIVTNLPAICIASCNVRLLYCYKLSKSPIVFNTNNGYVKIPLYNYGNNSVTLFPFELTVNCTIILQKKPYYSSDNL